MPNKIHQSHFLEQVTLGLHILVKTVMIKICPFYDTEILFKKHLWIL